MFYTTQQKLSLKSIKNRFILHYANGTTTIHDLKIRFGHTGVVWILKILCGSMSISRKKIVFLIKQYDCFTAPLEFESKGSRTRNIRGLNIDNLGFIDTVDWHNSRLAKLCGYVPLM